MSTSPSIKTEVGNPPRDSISEEIISALWAICAVLSFGFGFSVFGWMFAIKALLDMYVSITLGIAEERESKKEANDGKRI